MQSRCLVCALALSALLLLVGTVPAGPIAWNYDWSGTTVVVKSDPASPTSAGTGFTSFVGTIGSGADTQSITAINLTTISAASSSVGAPDRYTNVPYTLKLNLTDAASHQSQIMTFGGLLNGTVTATEVHLSTVFTGSTTVSTTLGGNNYDVTIGPFTSPDAPGDPLDGTGSIKATVSASPVGSGGTGGGGTGGGTGGGGPGGSGGGIHNTPEPTSLLLAASGAGMIMWYRRRRESGR